MTIFDAIDFDLPGSRLQEVLSRYEARFKLRLTIHDCRGVFYHPDGRPFFPGRHIHLHPYCITDRFKIPGWNRNCHEECMLKVEAAADRLRKPFLHDCWKGITELVVPVDCRGSLALVLYAGVFRRDDAAMPADLPPFHRRLFAEIPVLNEPLLAELAPELQLLGYGLMSCIDRYRDRLGSPQEKHLQINRFLEDRAHENVGLTELAESLKISRSYACSLVKYHFGKPFHTLLREERIRRACNLLTGTDLPLKAVAAAVGFANEYYFSRLFRQECGIPPGKYRETQSRPPAQAGRQKFRRRPQT